MKPGKYAKHTFTTDQNKARALWRRSDNELSAINDALKIIPLVSDHKALHARLDRRLDAIEKRRVRAKTLFADVDESFTIFSLRMPL